MKLNKIHHVAVICSDYEKSKHFYTDVLGMKIVSENYREGRDSWKADCWLDDAYVIELFSFPNPPARPSYPEAAGLRHLAFEVDDLSVAIGTVLGIPTLVYLPFCFFNIISPLMSCPVAILGFVPKPQPKEDKASAAEESDIH